MSSLYGEKHKKLLTWLSEDWWRSGPAVCCLEGFPGVGKREIRRFLTDRLGEKSIPTVAVEVLEADAAQFDDLLLDLAQQYSAVGDETLARLIETGADSSRLIGAFAGTLKHPTLVVLEGFQQALGKQSGQPSQPFQRLLRAVENQNGLQGRVLLLTERSPHPGRWSSQLKLARVEGLEIQEGVRYLSALLKEHDREQEVPIDRRADVVSWVGGNPQALRSVVAALRYEPLDALIELNVEAWELREQEISEGLLAELEKQLLAHVLAKLELSDCELLFGLSVFRKPFPAEGIERFAPVEGKKIRDRLVDNFLLRHDRGWYSPEKVAREIASGFLKQNQQRLKAAHSIAADFYARHFRARQVVGGGRIGGYFVEARFHLVQAGRADELSGIVGAFERHIKSEIRSVSPVPTDPRELDERIAVLSALLAEEGAKGLEYHLARCLEARRQGSDHQRALTHARRALSANGPSDSWVLAGRLAADVEGIDSGVAILERGLSLLQPAELSPIYQACAELLARENRTKEAIELLREGITTVPPQSNLSPLYQACAELIARANRPGEAIELLREGISKLPPQFSLSPLYQACAELMAQENRTGEAIDLLREGITKVPPQLNLFVLYHACAKLMARENRAAAAIDFLREGITKVPPQFSLFVLYQFCSELMARENRTKEAMELLRNGITKVPPNLNGDRLAESAVYLAAACGNHELLENLCAGGTPVLAAEQRALGAVLLLQAKGDWVGAAEEARRGQSQHPTYVALCAQEAFSWLAAKQADQAQSALDRFLLRGGHPWTGASAWVASFVALAAGRQELARQLYLTYVGEGRQAPAQLIEYHLLQQWNSPMPLSTPHPAYYWPTLPPSLTGLDHAVRRGPPWNACPEIESLTRECWPSAMDVPQSETGRPLAQKPDLRFLVMATEWRSRHGGVSTFNRALCSAIARAGCPVVCVAPSFDVSEIAEAKEAGVQLVPAPGYPCADDLSGLSRRLKLPEGFTPNVVIGHGRITGFAAQAQVAEFYPDAMRVHFVHVASGEIEFYKGKKDAAEVADGRERIEVDLAKDCALVVALGPRLEREAGNFLAPLQRRPALYRLDPPVGPSLPQTPPPGMHCLLVGRAEDFELKGLDIAALAMGRVLKAAIFDHQPELVVRGAPKGTGGELRERLQGIAKSDLPIRVREYSDDQQAIESDLRRSSVLLMPSRREGFGLVACEAVGVGTPILVSDKSGIGELLKERLGASEAQNYVVTTADDLDTAAAAWAKAIEFVLRDLKASFERARTLSRTLASRNSWESAVDGLLEEIEKARQSLLLAASVQ
jgi:glycosyltransferase involved in cell wall biosynthesis/tetratricopeptide (TPR) repeat protein